MIRRVVMLALLVCGCEAVPSVTYSQDDASIVVDGGSSCADNPPSVPSYASMCCGPIACFGPNCPGTCSDCISLCKLDELCCPNAQFHATCSRNMTCP